MSKEVDKPAFVQQFARKIEEAGGDTFFVSGDWDRDYDWIVNMIKHQGYWSGASVRYYFDKDYNVTRVEERQFGNGA